MPASDPPTSALEDPSGSSPCSAEPSEATAVGASSSRRSRSEEGIEANETAFLRGAAFIRASPLAFAGLASVGASTLGVDSDGQSEHVLPSGPSPSSSASTVSFNGKQGADFLWVLGLLPAAGAKCCQRVGFFSISLQEAESESMKLAMWPKNCSQGGKFACAFSEILKYFCTSTHCCIACSSSRLRVLVSLSSSATRLFILPLPSNASSSCCVSRCVNSNSLWNASMAALSSPLFSRDASCTCWRLSLKSCRNVGSEDLMVMQRKCSVLTAPVLKDASVISDSMAKARTVPSRASSTPWLMKFPTRRTTLRSSRSCVLPRTSSAARRSVRHLSARPEYVEACERANFMSFSRATLRGRVQKGMTFCSTSRSLSTSFVYSSSFLDSSAVGMTMMSSSTSSMLSRGSSKFSSCRQAHSSSEETFSLPSTIAMF
mmetsp:Transcript_8124/g.22831  ORF Transcript_8124/g.22831 Transcript_8124/m.22831 type:complete len:432 (-) Transcript_8124:488-1783(-)